MGGVADLGSLVWDVITDDLPKGPSAPAPPEAPRTDFGSRQTQVRAVAQEQMDVRFGYSQTIKTSPQGQVGEVAVTNKPMLGS